MCQVVSGYKFVLYTISSSHRTLLDTLFLMCDAETNTLGETAYMMELVLYDVGSGKFYRGKSILAYIGV